MDTLTAAQRVQISTALVAAAEVYEERAKTFTVEPEYWARRAVETRAVELAFWTAQAIR
jgi:hypothetical protein